MIKWNKENSPYDEPILVKIEMGNGCVEYFSCHIDENDTLLNTYGDDIGWIRPNINGWVSIADLLTVVED